jgi:hypothetical protein
VTRVAAIAAAVVAGLVLGATAAKAPLAIYHPVTEAGRRFLREVQRHERVAQNTVAILKGMAGARQAEQVARMDVCDGAADDAECDE